MGHGHYEPPETFANPLRPSWLISNEAIDATGADYVALGHWDRPAQVGSGVIPAYYSGSPEWAKTVNLVFRLTDLGGRDRNARVAADCCDRVDFNGKLTNKTVPKPDLRFALH